MNRSTAQRKHSEAILAILQDLAPNGPAQEECAQMFRTLERETGGDNECLKQMVGSLWDGLAYGNWPWVHFGGERK